MGYVPLIFAAEKAHLTAGGWSPHSTEPGRGKLRNAGDPDFKLRATLGVAN
jgi:hypothetical protein